MTSGLRRRRFLEFLAGSPLLAQGNGKAELNQMFSVMDFEAAAEAAIAPAHWGYLQTGVDDDLTLKANRAAFGKLYLRPRRMVDVTKVDAGVTLFGEAWPTPIVLAPAGSQKAYHAEGETAVARAARDGNYLQILSTVSSTPVEEIAKIHRRPFWYQLYPTPKWENTTRMVRRAEAAGCPVLVITVDTQGGRNTETEARAALRDTRPCSACHPTTPEGRRGRRPMPMFDGFQNEVSIVHNPAQTWAALKRYRELTRMKIVLKGLETAEDARLAVEHGVDGIIVSNHGARAVESGRGTLDALPEVVEAVQGRLPVLIDGGFRRGTDIFKALALGATAVCVGRPYLWALGAFGEPGVAKVLEILAREFRLTMTQCGVTKLGDINKSYVGFQERRPVW
jgi:isopentenyl diphosphate isomerase/L-lactate dehydrogenase-like FMN-dependent dehydrogenase